MSRNLLIGSFVFFFILALYFYFRRDPSLQNISIQQSPYLKLHKFKYSKYSNEKLVKFLEGDEASLPSVSLVELSGNVRAWRMSSSPVPKKEELEAKIVQAHLSSKELGDFQKTVNVTDTFLGGGVKIKREDLVIYTQEAHYLGSQNNAVVGDRPVHATLKTQAIDSANGFKLDLEKEAIELLGPVNGVIIPNENK